MKTSIKQINQSLGKSAQIGLFTGEQFVICGVIFATVFVINIALGVSLVWSILMGIWASATILILTGDRPYLFWSKVYPSVPIWTRGYARYSSPQSKEKIGVRTVQIKRNQKRKLTPFEDGLDLVTLVRLQKEAHTIGAYLLSKKLISDSNNTLQLVFGYTCTGIHPLFNSEAQIETVAKAFENGCKEIPDGETFTFRWSSFCDDSDATEYFKKRVKNPVSPETEFLDWAQLARTQQLTRRQQRKNISLSIYTTYTISPGGVEAGDALDKAITKFVNFLQKRFTPTGGAELTQKRLSQILSKAIDISIRHQQILSEMGLSPQAKTEKQLWQELCMRVGANFVKIPHTLVFDGMALTEEFNENTQLPLKIIDEAHATSILLNNGVPFADRKWVCLPTPKQGKKYVGVMTLSRKPEAFSSTAGQIRFLWDVFSRNNIFDIEVLTQISPADRGLTRLAQQTITRRSRSLDLHVQSRKSIDVSAQINVERSVEAQQKLYTGDVPLNTSLVILVYRDTAEEVDDAIRLITGYINQPTELTKETEYAWLIWLQTLLVRQEAILVRPYNRRLTFFASEVLGLTSVVQTASADNQGFELIADEGHSPVKIDLSRTKNILVLGTTGSGKSVLVTAILSESLAQGMSILMLDLPNDDGTGTFGDFTPYYGGFYFNIAKESNNLVQPLDLSRIPSAQTEERIQSHRNDVNLIVLQLVLGSQKFDGFLAQTIESLIPLGVKAFYDDLQIQKRFELARIGGIGTAEWDDTPTVVDMKKFFSTEYINLGYEDENVDKALNYIRLRLEYRQASAIGNAICKPSTFQTDAKLIRDFQEIKYPIDKNNNHCRGWEVRAADGSPDFPFCSNFNIWFEF